MASTKISALTDASTALETDEVPVARSGANRRLTLTEVHALRGLLVSAKTSAGVDYANLADAVINYATVSYDPGSDVTTGAGWVYTVPATGWYEVKVTSSFVDPKTAAWGANAYVQLDLYVNGSIIDTLAYFESGGTAGTDQWILLSGSRAVSLTAADTVNVKFYNESAATRQLGIGATIEIYRVA